jgi:hypothetical protein
MLCRVAGIYAHNTQLELILIASKLPQAPTIQIAVWKPPFRISAVILITLIDVSAPVLYSPS